MNIGKSLGLSNGAPDETQPMMSHAAAQADELLQRGSQAIRDTSQQLRNQAMHANEVTVDYIRRQPVKSVLIAAATGAVIVALLSLFTRSRH
jgi:ElaB/YqjD/DUF883 family membrane-anchored ribosome-binding protein